MPYPLGADPTLGRVALIEATRRHWCMALTDADDDGQFEQTSELVDLAQYRSLATLIIALH